MKRQTTKPPNSVQKAFETEFLASASRSNATPRQGWTA
jgi:hypothetical protein